MGSKPSSPKDIFGDIKGPIEDSFRKIIKPIEDEINDITEEVNDITETIVENAEKVDKGFNNLPGKIKDLTEDVVLDKIWKPINEALVIPATNFFNTITMYLNCTLDKIEHFWGCFFWYVIYIFQETIHNLIIGICFINEKVTGNNILLNTYNEFLNGLGKASDICNEYTGYQLFIFPYSDQINANCFTCNATVKPPIIQTELQYLKQKLQTEKQKFSEFTKGIANDITNIAGAPSPPPPPPPPPANVK
jgi:hypothetical protein